MSSVKWIFQHKRRMKALQKAIHILNDEAVQISAESEKYFSDLGARYGKYASDLESEEEYEGQNESHISSYLQRKGRCEEIAKEFADKKRFILEGEVSLLQSLQKKEIEAFQDFDLTTNKLTRLFGCFF